MDASFKEPYICRIGVVPVSYQCHTRLFVLQFFKNCLCCCVVSIPIPMSVLPRVKLTRGNKGLWFYSYRPIFCFFRIKYKFSLSITLLQAVGFLSPQKTKMYASLHSMTASFFFSGFKKPLFLKVQSNLNLYPLWPKTLRFEGFVS